MNLYFLVDGEATEMRVYREWLRLVFPGIERAERVEDMQGNHFMVLSGGGIPSYLDLIPKSLQDIGSHGEIDCFFVCVDAEDATYEHRYKEAVEAIGEELEPGKFRVIVQNCCIETWFLGNRKAMKRNPQSEKLRSWKTFFDVSQDDPEEMPRHEDHRTRAQFHLAYLREMLREHGRERLVYKKNSPGSVLERHYLNALYERWSDTQHIGSFGVLVKAWQSLGGQIPVVDDRQSS